MFRSLAIFLLTTYLSLGPALFERIHVAQASAALASIPAPRLASRTPLKRLPVSLPVHDPSACAICAILHAPMTTHFLVPPSFAPLLRTGWTHLQSPPSIFSPLISCDRCRGPPAL